ncbi:uncharacterized protein A4U43_C03F17810 [Asparagus officinalis]|uniref:Uncharacterized protein n=1 Tax=Asparagus officinalis TaxID=4686 RepID=A0A5P1FAW6_ASPOF|nr:uncharacterized protein A4U43_C03F17810 [Asparagus officinalis]
MNAIRSLSSAKVRVQCRTRATSEKTCSFDGVTDATGTYKILVADEHEHDICESVLISSPDGSCQKIVQGRERAQVFLTHNNGMASDTRFANALGFERKTPFAFCAQLMKQYEEVDV